MVPLIKGFSRSKVRIPEDATSPIVALGSTYVPLAHLALLAGYTSDLLFLCLNLCMMPCETPCEEREKEPTRHVSKLSSYIPTGNSLTVY